MTNEEDRLAGELCAAHVNVRQYVVHVGVERRDRRPGPLTLAMAHVVVREYVAADMDQVVSQGVVGMTMTVLPEPVGQEHQRPWLRAAFVPGLADDLVAIVVAERLPSIKVHS